MIPYYVLAFPTLAALIGLAAFIWIDRMLRDARVARDHWQKSSARLYNEAHDLARQLWSAQRRRSEITRRGNITKSAKRKALQDATTAQLEDASHG